MMARKGKLDLSLGIAVSSTSQIALFVLPLIVIAAVIMGISFPLILTPLIDNYVCWDNLDLFHYAEWKG